MFLYWLSNLGMGGGGVVVPVTAVGSLIDPDAASFLTLRAVIDPGLASFIPLRALPSSGTTADALLLEDGTELLLEDGTPLLLEGALVSVVSMFDVDPSAATFLQPFPSAPNNPNPDLASFITFST